ncbi:MAG: MFS transporter [Sorangiineae bacterium]|nr:MFS transporter [Polyangiaceae bacterium]MEB2321296.1 MFS transporter [Sorangiineae bacterium]
MTAADPHPSAATYPRDAAFRARRFLNWFPLGLAYALLYMGRYNLTVAKTSLGHLMTNEDFGLIFAAGTVTYALAFLVNGPLVDRVGGRKGMLIGLTGALFANLAMGAYLAHVLASESPGAAPLRGVFSALYAVNMYFQSYGAVSIVKVNAHWFHVTERGGFSGVFGAMIASGIFFAFTGNAWFLELAKRFWKEQPTEWVVFVVPAALLALILVIESFLLRDRPSQAGLQDFDTGDASSGDASEEPLPTLELFKRLFTNPIILTVAGIEFCTGVVRNGVMHWFPIYASQIWALPSAHPLRNGSWEHFGVVVACFATAAVSGVLARYASGRRRAVLAALASLAFLAPFLQGGWGGLLFVSGVIGGNVAGWVSDLFFQSRRGPAAAGMYALMLLSTAVMYFTLSPAENVVASAAPESGLHAGDRIVSIAGVDRIRGWTDVRRAVSCWEPRCSASTWSSAKCACASGGAEHAGPAGVGARPIPAVVERAGQTVTLALPDPAPVQRAGDGRLLRARPELPLSPWFLGVVVFLMSLATIGCHGVLSGTATMDFGGRKAAATAVGAIDGLVYLGTALQSVSLGFLTTRSWSYWPLFLLPFTVLGLALSLRIWGAKPAPSRGH